MAVQLSIITPAFNEQQNLHELHQRLLKTLSSINITWEWLIIDDHSSDQTFAIIEELSRETSQIRGIRLARNFGSHAAFSCGLQRALGECTLVLACDLQDPPELIPKLLDQLKEGNQVVWAVRRSRPGENPSKLGLSRLFYFVMRNFVGFSEMPKMGADFFLIDKKVMVALQQFTEANLNIIALITWMGFKQSHVEYDKPVRQHGKSGWSFERKLKLFVDSITSFTYLPIRLMSYFGFIVAFAGFVYAAAAIYNAYHGSPTEGWTSLIVVVLVIGGLQMIMMGVLGEYLWRVLDQSRRRPPFLVESDTA